jgi:hypothetical protein
MKISDHGFSESNYYTKLPFYPIIGTIPLNTAKIVHASKLSNTSNVKKVRNILCSSFTTRLTTNKF